MADDQRRLLKELTGPDGVINGKLRGLVFPRWRARRHPTANLLLQYAQVRCPVSVGPDWNPDEMEAAVSKGPHSSALEDDAISKIQIEAREKSAQDFATIMRWDDIKHNPPSNLKISSLAMIPHKSRKYRAIFDLSFLLKVTGWDLTSVNEATKETAPAEALEQLGMVMPRIIKALATAPVSEDPIHFVKLDIKDGFWRIVFEVGEEWNLAYVLPNRPEAPTELVIPSALQIGWTLSPYLFHVASETACDVAESYTHKRVGTLPEHPFEGIIISELLGLENSSMWGPNKRNKFLTLLVLYRHLS